METLPVALIIVAIAIAIFFFFVLVAFLVPQRGEPVLLYLSALASIQWHLTPENIHANLGESLDAALFTALLWLWWAGALTAILLKLLLCRGHASLPEPTPRAALHPANALFLSLVGLSLPPLGLDFAVLAYAVPGWLAISGVGTFGIGTIAIAGRHWFRQISTGIGTPADGLSLRSASASPLRGWRPTRQPVRSRSMGRYATSPPARPTACRLRLVVTTGRRRAGLTCRR
jgi:hypothetical protein